MSIIKLVRSSNLSTVYQAIVSCFIVAAAAAAVTAATKTRVRPMDKETDLITGDRFAVTGPHDSQNARDKQQNSIAADTNTTQRHQSSLTAGSVRQSYNKTDNTYSSLNVSSNVNGQEFDNEEGDNSTVFNITNAIRRGVKAQYEVCDQVCNGTGSRPLQEEHNCWYTNPWCFKCHCDQACEMYGDCCPSLASQSLPHIGERGPHLCLELNLGLYTEFVQAIASCPFSSEDTPGRAENCTRCGRDDSVLRQPVVSLETYALYCNPDCALCNGETNFTAIKQTPCVDIAEESVQDEMFGDYNTSTNKQFDLSDTTQPATVASNDTAEHVTKCYQILNVYWPIVQRRCRKEADVATKYVSTCNETIMSDQEDGDILDSLCRQYSYPVFTQDAGYRNLFCALCNGVVPTEKACRDSVVVMEQQSAVEILTALGSIETSQHAVVVRQYRDKQWYDYVLDKWRPVSCEIGRVWVTGEPYCTDPASSANVTVYRMYLRFTPVTNATRLYCLRNWTIVRDTVIAHLASAARRMNSPISVMGVFGFETNLESMDFGVSVWLIASKSDSQTEFELKIVEYFADPGLLSLEIPDDGRFAEFETNLEPIITYGSRHTVVCRLNSSHCDLVDGYFDIFRHFRENIFGDSQSELNIIIFNPFTPYAMVFLNVSEFEQDASNMITLTYVNASIDSGKLQITAGGLSVPIIYLQEAYAASGLSPDSTRNVRVRHWSHTVKQMLSLSCLVVSIISLVFLLTTYCAFSELRTLPGINNMFLSVWLLVAQVLLLAVPTRTEVPAACRVMGASLHYAWLCVFAWSSVCSFHMFHVFVTQRDRMVAPHRQRWYVKRYVLFAHALPGIIVALVIGSVAGGSEGEEVGYGGHVCYLNSVLLRGVAFVLPLGLAVAFNLLQLALTARELSRATHVQSYGGQKEPGNVCIYAKLSSLTGLCWMLALISEVPGCQWLSYVSVVLNGLQGLHLAVSYTANRRVMRLWRKKITRTGRESKTGQSNTFTSSSSGRHQSGHTLSSSV